MLVALPDDVVVAIASRLDHASAERMVACARAQRRLARDDARFWQAVARAAWGDAFWTEALARPTVRTFRGWRGELRTMDAFERACVAQGHPPWTEREYRAWWRAEAAFFAAQTKRRDER